MIIRALLLWVFVLLFIPPYSGATPDIVVFELFGNGTRNTRPFEVKDHWEIRW